MFKTILLIGNGKLSKSLQPLLSDYQVHVFDETNINELQNHLGDLLIDCSLPSSFNHIYKYLRTHLIHAIICSTGHNKEELNLLKELSNKIPIFQSENFSLGINLLNRFIKNSSSYLSQYDCHILDIHHKDKKDSPSGTSIKLSETLTNVNHLSIRSSNCLGQHEIYFISNDEEIKLSHKSISKEVYAKGILLAIEYIKNKRSGYFTMEDLIDEI